MLRGRFGNTSGRPYIEGRLLLPKLNLRSDISFLVDTGADRSMLMPADAQRMGVDYSDLTGDSLCTGMGGTSHNFIEPSVMAFSEPGKALYVYQIEMLIPPPDADIEDLPSILGRDILDQWSMSYYPAKSRLTFRVLSADFTMPITSKHPSLLDAPN